MSYDVSTIFQIGDLVHYNDLIDGLILCVVIAGGVAGYSNETREIYVVYSLKNAGVYISYDSDLSLVKVS